MKNEAIMPQEKLFVEIQNSFSFCFPLRWFVLCGRKRHCKRICHNPLNIFQRMDGETHFVYVCMQRCRNDNPVKIRLFPIAIRIICLVAFQTGFKEIGYQHVFIGTFFRCLQFLESGRSQHFPYDSLQIIRYQACFPCTTHFVLDFIGLGITPFDNLTVAYPKFLPFLCYVECSKNISEVSCRNSENFFLHIENDLINGGVKILPDKK